MLSVINEQQSENYLMGALPAEALFVVHYLYYSLDFFSNK